MHNESLLEIGGHYLHAVILQVVATKIDNQSYLTLMAAVEGFTLLEMGTIDQHRWIKDNHD